MYSVSIRPIAWDYYSSCLRAVLVGRKYISLRIFILWHCFFFTHNDRHVNLFNEQQQEEEEAEGKSLGNVWRSLLSRPN